MSSHVTVHTKSLMTAGTLASVLALAGCSSLGAPGSSGCADPQDTQYIPSRSPAVFERDGVQVAVQRVYYKTLTVEVSSSDGTYSATQVDPTATLFQGLELTTEFGMGFANGPFDPPGQQEQGQVRPILRVYDCWTVVSGPGDLF